MSRINSRAKGAAGEREFANYLREHGYEARRGQQFSGGADSPDVIGLPGVHHEVKRVETFSLYPGLEQAIGDAGAGSMPVVAHRRNRKPWVAILLMDDFLKLYSEAKRAA